MFNKGEGGFKDRDLYVFCANASDGVMTAHPNLKGETDAGHRRQEGVSGRERDHAERRRRKDQGGHLWWPRPGSDKPLEKHAFYTRVRDQNCGVGYYKE
jgi:hypothetical protein